MAVTALVARKAASEETEPLLGLFPAGSRPRRDTNSCRWDILALPIPCPTGLAYAIVGSIGADTGAGLLGLIQCAAIPAILFVTVAVTRNQPRADRVLFALMTATDDAVQLYAFDNPLRPSSGQIGHRGRVAKPRR
jgi:hypothetical protein